MKYGPVPLEQAQGKILGHHITGPDGRRALRKGKSLSSKDIAELHQLGRKSIYVAELEPGDIDENRAAERIARAAQGCGVELSKAHAGRVNLKVSRLGLVQVDPGRLFKLNQCTGITLATLASGSVARPQATVATVKVIPFAVGKDILEEAEALAKEGEPLISLRTLPARKVSVVFSGSLSARQRVLEAFEVPINTRIEGLGSSIGSRQFVPLEDETGEEKLARVLRQEVSDGSELIMLVGETAIMDRRDIAPRAVERAGGEVTCFGAPVDPGNLLMLAYLGDVAVLGAPGCARSLKTNVIDWVLPRLLAGEHLSRADILALGHGGLLEDTSQRPSPRNDRVSKSG